MLSVFSPLLTASVILHSSPFARFRTPRTQGLSRRAGGYPGAVSYMRHLIPKAVGYSFTALLCLVVCAPIIPDPFGSSMYALSRIRWLALSPLLKTIHFFYANTLPVLVTSIGHTFK